MCVYLLSFGLQVKVFVKSGLHPLADQVLPSRQKVRVMHMQALNLECVPLMHKRPPHTHRTIQPSFVDRGPACVSAVDLQVSRTTKEGRSPTDVEAFGSNRPERIRGK